MECQRESDLGFALEQLVSHGTRCGMQIDELSSHLDGWLEKKVVADGLLQGLRPFSIHGGGKSQDTPTVKIGHVSRNMLALLMKCRGCR